MDRHELYEYFESNNIYVAAIDQDIKGFRVCFGSHRGTIIVPLNVLNDLHSHFEDCDIWFEQLGVTDPTRGLYAYIHITKKSNN